jgi:hypothetical protein
MRKGVVLSGAVLIGMFFLYGLWNVFAISFAGGDIYPAYSSLRGDQEGTRVLYESLSDLDGMTVTRNYGRFGEIDDEHDATVLFLGQEAVREEFLPYVAVTELESFVAGGGRLVVTYFLPDEKAFASPEGEERETQTQPKKKTEEAILSLNDRWGIHFAVASPGIANEVAELNAKVESVRLPTRIPNRTRMHFEKLDRSWRILYRSGGHPVIVEKLLGKGSIVFSAPSYYCSNVAMLRDRRPGLLAWLVGDHRKVIFDEYSHGVGNDPGIAALARKYGLQPLLGVILAVVALFVWKNSVPLVPPYRDGAARVGEKGRGSVSGLRNLLRRSIPSGQIFPVCLAEWKKSLRAHEPECAVMLEKAERVLRGQEALPRRQRNAVSAYNRVSQICKDKVG